ncbi:restriction endonuclease subunit S [Streptococcus agalactiae]|uniref:restriction endonuclease subunit S n=1 Tax=Streptococcus agalactiae TaxID=1311 RepID=UPI0021BC2B1E|nr:restriction endonuclease subunit S [Streptococcus agalactiae]
MKKIKDERLKLQNLQNLRIVFMVQTLGILAILGYEFIRFGFDKVISDPLWLVFLITGIVNHHLLEQARLLYKNLISSNDTKYQNLSDIARITMGQSPKGETYNDDKIGLPLLNGATDFRNSISPSKWTSDPRKIARPGEYVFGVRATIGLTTKIFKEYAIGRGTGSAKPISNIFDEYLFFALEDLFDYYANLGSGTVYINISKSDFDSFKVILPIKDQFLVDFHKTVQPLFNLIFNNNAEIQKLSELRDCLLPKLLPGEISINQATK